MLVQMDVRSVLSAAFRQMWKFLLVFVPIVLIGLFYTLTATRYYESSAKMIVKFGQDARPEISLGSISNLTAEEKRGLVQSNVNILRSRDLAEQLIADIGIGKAYPEIAKTKLSDAAKLEAALKEFNKNLITKTESDAGVIVATIYHPDPKLGEDMLTQLIELFLNKQAEVFGNPQMAVLREQAEEANLRLENANKALYDYKAATGIASIDEELTLLLQQRGDMVGYLSRRQTEPGNLALPPAASGSKGEISIDSSDYEEATGDEAPAEPVKTTVAALPVRIGIDGDSSRFPVIEDSQRKIEELRSREAELLLTYRPDSDVVKNVRRNLAAETAALEKSLQALNEQITELDRQIAEKQEQRSTYDELTREVDLSAAAFETAQQRLQAAEVNNDLNERKITRISVIEEPITSVKPRKPNKMLILALCLIIGAAFGAGLGLGTEILDSTFSRPEQIFLALKRPVLASFPHYAQKGLKDLSPSVWWNEKVSTPLGLKPMPVMTGPAKPVTKKLLNKELLALYQAIDTAFASRAPRIVNFSSAHNGEGTTTIAHEIAKLAAMQSGNDVLFIAPENFLPANSALPPRAPFSLLDVAQGRAQLKESIGTVRGEGTGSLNYAHLIKGAGIEGVLGNIDKLEDVLKELRQNFSMIVIPTPGVITNPAAASLTRVYDKIVFVVEAERTRAPVVKQALQILSVTGDKLLGLVMNKQHYYIPDWIYRRL